MTTEHDDAILDSPMGRTPLFTALLGEVRACSNHTRHSICGCIHLTGNIVRRLEIEGVLTPGWDRSTNP